MLRERVGREGIGREVVHIVGLIARSQRTAGDTTDERKDDLVLLRRPAIDACQPLDHDLQPALLAHLTHDALPRRLAALQAAAGLIPPVTVGAVTEQYPAALVTYGGEDANAEGCHAEDLSFRGMEWTPGAAARRV